MEEEHFDLEKILTISPRDYCESTGKELINYEFIGVHSNEIYEIKEFGVVYAVLDFAKEIPSDAEVVLNYRSSVSVSENNVCYIASGTALIPKTRFTSGSQKLG